MSEAQRNECPNERLVILPEHPCYCGEGEYDHNWEFQDDSFDHEFGTETVHYFMCAECGATRDIETSDYDPFWELDW